MIVNMSFMVLLNFLRVNTQVSGIIPSSKHSHPTIIDHLNDELKNTTIAATNTRARLLNYLLVDESTTRSDNPPITGSYPAVEILHRHFLSILSYMETWLSKDVNASQSTSQLYHHVEPNAESLTRPNPPSEPLPTPTPLNDVTIFQLWKQIGTKNNGNFTLENTRRDDEYDNFIDKSNRTDRDRDDADYASSRMKAILVKDTRYRSLMKKWITNRRRHGRDFPTDISSNFNRSEVSNSTSGASLNTTSDDGISKANCLRENNSTSCNASSNVDDKSTNDHDDPEARFYDPLMPYPEEYPEEYQTIQNGPALIISRTTYTRIPNVTYTTITMVTLPTYRLVEKAENAFAATLFEERSSKSSAYLHDRHRCTHCDKHSSLRHPKV